MTTGNGGAGECWGADIGNPGSYIDPTTDSRLKSPRIDLTSMAAAELSFAYVTRHRCPKVLILRALVETKHGPAGSQ